MEMATLHVAIVIVLKSCTINLDNITFKFLFVLEDNNLSNVLRVTVIAVNVIKALIQWLFK